MGIGRINDKMNEREQSCDNRLKGSNAFQEAQIDGYALEKMCYCGILYTEGNSFVWI